MVARLETEIRALMRRGNLNLVLGTVTTTGAVAVLAYIALTATVTVENWRAVLPTYALRLSLVVFVEVFAFFFLRLYRASLHDIKYFQNEITNIQSRFLALEFSVLSSDGAAANKVIDELARTERNFVLSKGQTTLEIERVRLESRLTRDALSQIKNLVPWDKAK